MKEGLEGVVDFLLRELAFAGEQGLSIASFLAISKKYLDEGRKAVQAVGQRAQSELTSSASSPEAPTILSDSELSFARGAWNWLVARRNVVVGGNRRWNKLSLDEVLSLPELENTAEQGTDSAPAQTPSSETGPLSSNISTPQLQRAKPISGLSTRPRICVADETVWQAIAGHGIDYKRIPKLEWDLLQGVASAKQHGILQGDLRRLVGQDKRSVPKRTDFLAAKGYIVKRSIMIHASKTSKLWLTMFAPSTSSDATEASGSQDMMMTKATLARDLSPVPWHAKWTGNDIDLAMFAETLIAIAKAWGVMRYSDLRSKMGVEDLRWQMRNMARLSRNLVDMGILKYTAATFSNSRKVWKDCIKFLRDPTETEWAKILATGKKTSKYSDLTNRRQPKPHALSLVDKSTAQTSGKDDDNANELLADNEPSATLSWVPEKPLVQTILDAVEAAGPGGATTPQISASTVGYNFRRYIGTMLTNMSICKQPAHLQKYQINRQLVRQDKTSAYIYSTNHLPPSRENMGDVHTLSVDANVSTAGSSAANQPSLYGFAPIQEDKHAASTTSLSEISRKLKGRRGLHRPPKRPYLGTQDVAEVAIFPERRPVDDDDDNNLPLDGGDDGSQSQMWAEKLPGKTPGAYIGEPGSLNPNPKKTGRPRRSLVVIFKSDKLKDPAFWKTKWVAQRLMPPSRDDVDEAADAQAVAEIAKAAETTESTPQDKALIEAAEDEAAGGGTKDSTPADTAPIGDEEPPETRAKGKGKPKGKGKSRKRKNGPNPGLKTWKCEKCGGTWKNDIGLKYHLTKAQTPCNPDYVPGPPRKRRRMSFTPPPGAEYQGAEKEPGVTGQGTPANRSSRRTTRDTGTLRPRRQRLRTLPRLLDTGEAAFRGLAVDTSYLSRGEEQIVLNLARPVDEERGLQPVTHSVPSPVLRLISQLDRPRGLLSVASAADGGEKANDNPQDKDAVITIGDPDGTVTYDDSIRHKSPDLQHHEDTTMTDASPNLQTPGVAYAPASSLQVSEVASQPEEVREPAPNMAGDPTLASNGEKEKPPRRRPLPSAPVKRSQDSKAQPIHPQMQSDQNVGSVPPFRPANYQHLTSDSKMRTAQALDIIGYLLDNNGGVFPADKALFYAVLRIFLKTFSGQAPPSYRNYLMAVKRLTTKDRAREIVHAFRNSNGKFATCNMLIATAIDPNGIVPTVLKKKMQEAYPAVFIPAAFSPSKEELRLLDEFDKEPPESDSNTRAGGKFRLRRENTEVEILNAPFYQERPPPNAGIISTMDSGHRGDGLRKNSRKRGFEYSLSDQPGSSAKKMKTLGSQILQKKAANERLAGFSRTVDDVDLESSEHEVTDALGVAVRTPLYWGAPSMLDNPTIASAIKAYGLLPSNKGGRKKPAVINPLTSIPEVVVARAPNPGLDTLPTGFFSNKTEKSGYQLGSLELKFLAPNTRLQDIQEDAEDEEFPGFSPIFEATPVPAQQSRYPAEDQEMRPVEEYVFVPPTLVLKDSSQGVWPDLPWKFYETEHVEESLTMQGWIAPPRWILLQHLPTSVTDMASKCRRKHTILERYADPVYADFCDVIDRCATWETSKEGSLAMTFGTLVPDYIYINVGSPADKSQMMPIKLDWSPENQFNMTSLPYEELSDDEEPRKVQIPNLAAKRGRGRPLGSKATTPKKAKASERLPTPEKKRLGRKPKRIRLPALEVEREHTAYPQSAEEYMDIHHGEERTVEWNSEHTQLAAFVSITTLLGGVGKAVDWGLMMRLFPDMSLSHLRKFWGEMNKDRKSTILDLTEKFQKAFLTAYEKNEVPKLDYNNILAYDWKFLTLWTRNLGGDKSNLPPSYDEIAQRDMAVTDRVHQPRDWRETFWISNRSLYNRYQDASSQAFAFAIDPIEKQESDNLLVAMTWVRALCVTAQHPPQVVSRKWESFKGLRRAVISDLIDEAIKVLQERLIITKDKSLNGMRLNDRVVKTLDKGAHGQKFAEAAAFKRRLDRAFRQGKAKYRVKYVADNDGMTMAILNLQAHGRITLESDNRYVPLGYEPFNYETRKFDRKYHHFRVFIVPTESYLYSDYQPTKREREQRDNGELAELLSAIAAATPPREGPNGELPLWCNFFESVDEIRWRKSLGSVLFLLSTRGPMDAEALAEQVKCLMKFEIQLILDWADKLGLMEWIMPASPKCIAEWWWLAVDTQASRVRGKDEGPSEVPRVSRRRGRGARADFKPASAAGILIPDGGEAFRAAESQQDGL